MYSFCDSVRFGLVWVSVWCDLVLCCVLFCFVLRSFVFHVHWLGFFFVRLCVIHPFHFFLFFFVYFVDALVVF